MRILQAFGVLAAFVIIVVLSVKRVALWKVMCLATIVMALSSGIPMSQSAKIIWGSFTDITTIHLALSVFSIGAFSTIMNGTGYLDNMVRGLSGLLGNLKAAIMAVPALVGSMPVLGGAAVSAPLVDKLGDGLGLSPEKSYCKPGVSPWHVLCVPFFPKHDPGVKPIGSSGYKPSGKTLALRFDVLDCRVHFPT